MKIKIKLLSLFFSMCSIHYANVLFSQIVHEDLVSTSMTFICGFGTTEASFDLDVAEQDVKDKQYIDSVFKTIFETYYQFIGGTPSNVLVISSKSYKDYAWVGIDTVKLREFLTYGRLGIPFKGLMYRRDSIEVLIERYGVKSFELIGLILHEVSHLVNDHSIYYKNGEANEQHADKAIGKYFRFMHLSEEEAIRAVKNLHYRNNKYSRDERIKMVKQGWREADPRNIEKNSALYVLAMPDLTTEKQDKLLTRYQKDKFSRTLELESPPEGIPVSDDPVLIYPDIVEHEFLISEGKVFLKNKLGFLKLGYLIPSINDNYAYMVTDELGITFFVDSQDKIYYFDFNERIIKYIADARRV